MSRRPVAVMVSNSYDSLPQWGLSQADIIYEMLAEGRITRLLAIFKDPSKIDKLASVRSSRPYFIDIAQSYGAVYMHFGGSVPAYEAIAARKDLISMDGIRGGCGLLSVYIDTYEDMGAFRRGFGRTSATWEVRRGRAVGLGDIFFDPGQINRMAAEKIEEEIAAQQARCPGSFYYARRPSKWGWYLCAAGLAVYFQPGSIAPLNAGAPVFLLTWEQLAGRMKLGLPG